MRRIVTPLLPALVFALGLPAAFATTLGPPDTNNSGQLPLPPVLSTTAVGVTPAITNGVNSFTGAWSNLAPPPWAGLSFSGNNAYPNSAMVGVVTFNFAGMPNGLPVGTRIRLNDLDQSVENVLLSARDQAGNLITTAWLNLPDTASDANLNFLVQGAMPNYTFNNGVYAFTNPNVSLNNLGFNPLTTISLPTNLQIWSLEVDKQSTNFGIQLASGEVPEPATMGMLGLGVTALAVVGRRKKGSR